MATHFRTCTLCEAMCGLAIETDGPRVTSIRGDVQDPFSHGHICPKAVALQDLHEDPDRLRTPMRREGTEWRAIGWDEALDEAARRLVEVQREHGRHAVAVYQGNPTVHNHATTLWSQFFLRALQSRSRYSATSVDQLPQMLAGYLMFGHQLLMPVPDVDRCSYLLMLGANPAVSNGSLFSAGGVTRRLKELRARGGKLVVVDPRRTETAELADQHLPIRPGTDAVFLLALINVLDAEKLTKPGRLEAITDGLDLVVQAARPFTPEMAATITGIGADEIRGVARALASASAPAVYGRVGVSTQEFGGLSTWLFFAVNLLLGSLDTPGGMMFTTPAADTVAFANRIGQRGHYDKGRSRVRGLPEFGGEWPVSVLAEEIETPGKGQVRALVTVAGNPVLSTPNGTRLERALGGLELMVSLDPYLNETTRHAHLILPPVSPLEREHYDVVFHLLAAQNSAKWSPALFPAPAGAKHDWQILSELSSRLEARRGAHGARLFHRTVGALGPRGVIDLLLRTGPYGRGLRPGGLSLAKLEAHPHGIDLGPLTPSFPARLYTRNKRIDAAPKPFLDDLARLQRRLPELAAEGLVLIGRRELRSNNSWMHNSERLVKGRERCTLLMHPGDAAARGLADGQKVRVASRVGAVTAPLELSTTMRPGVVCLPHGWGHDRPGTRTRVASTRPGVSMNDLTDEQDLDVMAGTAKLSGVPVEVSAAG